MRCTADANPTPQNRTDVICEPHVVIRTDIQPKQTLYVIREPNVVIRTEVIPKQTLYALDANPTLPKQTLYVNHALGQTAWNLPLRAVGLGFRGCGVGLGFIMVGELEFRVTGRSSLCCAWSHACRTEKWVLKYSRLVHLKHRRYT